MRYLWESLFRLASPIDCTIGSAALDIVAHEAGFILVDADYIGAMDAFV